MPRRQRPIKLKDLPDDYIRFMEENAPDLQQDFTEKYESLWCYFIIKEHDEWFMRTK